MNILHHSRLIVLAVVFVLVMAIVGPAMANPPIIQDFQIDENYSFDCDGFTVEGHWEGRARLITYVDDAGIPTHFRAHLNITGSLTNTLTGLTVTATRRYTERWDDSTYRAMGLGSQFVLPNGEMISDHGILIWDYEAGEIIFEAGGHPSFHADLCLLFT